MTCHATPDPCEPRGRRALRAACCAAGAALAALSLACQIPTSSTSTGTTPPAPATNDLTPGEFRQGRIDCSSGDCSDTWDVSLSEGGVLRVDVYAPVGPDVPAFKVTLMTAGGRRLKSAPPTRHSPRRLEKTLDPGAYRVTVEGIGKDDGPLGYELVANVMPAPAAAPQRTTPTGGSGPATTTRSATPAPSPSSAATAPAPAPPGDGTIRAEVVDVEEPDPAKDNVLYVWLDRGGPDGIVKGARGTLVDGGQTIARFEVVEVFETGSRAAVRGQLKGDITFETVAEIPPRSAR